MFSMHRRAAFACFSFSLIFISSWSQGAVLEVSQMKSVYDDVASVPGTLLVSDIDNTLTEPLQSLGSDQWFSYRIEQHKKRLMPVAESMQSIEAKATKAALEEWEQVQRATQVRPVETSTPKLLTELKSKGFKVMALTARPISLIAVTVKQLHGVGIWLDKDPVVADQIKLSPTEQYQQGVLFIGPGGHKGKSLVAFLAKTQIKPSRVVFVDDRLTHCERVDQSMSEINLPHVIYRYSALDEKVKAFDPRIAEVQWLFFGKILPDSVAQLVSEGQVP